MNLSIVLLIKSMDWFLYDRDLCHERVNYKTLTFFFYQFSWKNEIMLQSIKLILTFIENVMKILFPTSIYLSFTMKHQNKVWNLFKVNHDAILVSLLSILNKFHPLFWCFHCKLKTTNGLMSYNRAMTVTFIKEFFFNLDFTIHYKTLTFCFYQFRSQNEITLQSAKLIFIFLKNVIKILFPTSIYISFTIKCQKKVRNLLKVNNRFHPLFGVSIVDLKQVHVDWVDE